MTAIKWEGEQEMMALLATVTKAGQKGMRTGLYAVASDIMEDAKERAPKDTGDLRGSGYVDRPKTEGGETSVELGFGGPSAPYAVIQHEREDFNHDIGEAKYLEKAIDGQAADAPRRLASAVADEILGTVGKRKRRRGGK